MNFILYLINFLAKFSSKQNYELTINITSYITLSLCVLGVF